MYPSGEIRWFFEGDVPADVSNWFESGGLGVLQPRRTDEYLLLPGSKSASVKFRDDRFEIKTIIQPPLPVSYPNRVSGVRDAWVKWSRKAEDPAALRRFLVDPSDRWVAVSKQRHLRLFALDNGYPTEVRPGDAWLNAGCQVELCSVGIESNAHCWSLGFEAFGGSADVFDYLDEVVKYFCEQPPPMELRQQRSMSYPVWLALSQ